MADGLLWALIAGAAAGALTSWLLIRRKTSSAQAALESQLARAQAELAAGQRTSEESREMQELILSSMRDGVLLLDAEGATVYANAALARHLGTTPDEAGALFPLALREAVASASAGDATNVLVELGTPRRWLRGQAVPAGEDGAVLLAVRDVTETRRLDAMRRDFVANASHELKTPVASIRAAAETLRDGALDDREASRRFTEQLEREALRLSRIVSDLLDLSRLESGSVLDERVTISALAADEVERLQDAARSRGILLTLHAEPEPEIRGSGRDLALLIRNLIDNAIRYTSDGGSVDVSVTVDGDRVVLRVSDTGAGIPQRDLPRIFERFYRVDRARSRETGGTGLGLAIVKHVAENHRGDVSVTSDLGVGSTFEVRLPVPDAAVAP
jgi:two-component system phosphate regulon sensor histidine kinase PhoR